MNPQAWQCLQLSIVSQGRDAAAMPCKVKLPASQGPAAYVGRSCCYELQVNSSI